jgi:hypothetical protein
MTSMNRLAHLYAAAAAATLATGLAACSSAGQPAAHATSTPTVSASQPVYFGVPTFKAKIQTTGAVRYSKAFTQPVPGGLSCADVLARGDLPGGRFKLPTPAAGKDLKIDIQIDGYHGVATYPPADLQKDNSDSIQLTIKGVTTNYVLTSHPAKPAARQAPGKEVLFVYKDGTGELAFSEAHKLGRSSGPAIAGIINWQCLP